MTFLQVLPGYNTNRFSFNVINWAGETHYTSILSETSARGFNYLYLRCISSHFDLANFFFSFSIYKIRSQESMNWRESPVLLLQHIGYLIITQLSVVKILSYSSLTDSLTRSWRKDESIRRVKKRKKNLRGGTTEADGDQSLGKKKGLKLLYWENFTIHRLLRLILYQFSKKTSIKL